ncbi:hypothetical protein [Azospirillum rugosum]|uniref:Uncharacterized protein n=1 Tax=Azospirillum rugosum TaxID=416170 RepID=A0ABS4SPW1_9PROT|nr:hypothetical protein [Azospirillum rugosum]MBP2293992.1 hypothetical protein [Azospirillum rugosum]MDQ0526821.1 hypothetical protein [Azospirillum rugosum]
MTAPALVAEDLVVEGAFALYRAENPHRVAEFGKGNNAEAAIAADFETYKGRYVRKFQDLRAALEGLGLAVVRGA